jgi:hypothetical protein
MQQAEDLIDGLVLFRFGAPRRIPTSMTLTLMDGFLLGGSHGLRFCGKLGRVRPVSQAYYESEKLFFCRDLNTFLSAFICGEKRISKHSLTQCSDYRTGSGTQRRDRSEGAPGALSGSSAIRIVIGVDDLPGIIIPVNSTILQLAIIFISPQFFP